MTSSELFFLAPGTQMTLIRVSLMFTDSRKKTAFVNPFPPRSNGFGTQMTPIQVSRIFTDQIKKSAFENRLIRVPFVLARR
jgi:hypothetical protein